MQLFHTSKNKIIKNIFSWNAFLKFSLRLRLNGYINKQFCFFYKDDDLHSLNCSIINLNLALMDN
jgi:hypothetical protein